MDWINRFSVYCPSCAVGAHRHVYKLKRRKWRVGVACVCCECGEVLRWFEVPDNWRGRKQRRQLVKWWNMVY